MPSLNAVLLAGLILAPDAAPGRQPAEDPVQVDVGIYINDIEAFRLRENQFVADFYIWFRWKGDGIKPIETFEVANGRIDSTTNRYVGTRGDDNYAYERVVATITQFWDVTRFPLDRQTLSIHIEDQDSEGSKIRYVADSRNSGVNPQVAVPGCTLGTCRAEVTSHTYGTNYGDLHLPAGHESAYSRFQFSLPVTRDGWGYFLKLLFGLYVATVISFIAFLIEPSHFDPRFGLGVGAIFAAVASQYVVSSALPETSTLTLVDTLHILSFFVILVSISESTLSLKLFCSADPARVKASRRLDRWSFGCLGFGYIAVSILLALYYR